MLEAELLFSKELAIGKEILFNEIAFESSWTNNKYGVFRANPYNGIQKKLHITPVY